MDLFRISRQGQDAHIHHRNGNIRRRRFVIAVAA